MKKLFIYSLFLVLSLLYWSCSKDSNPVNNTLSDKPTVEIISPANNSDVSDTTTILVNASDDKGVTRVEIFIDDSLVTKLFNAPYKYVWDTRLLKDSTNHSIYARVYDTDSNMVGSKIVKVTNYFLSPTNLKATQIADGTILLTWNDNSKVETGYEVEQSINGSTFTKIHTLGASITKDTIYSLIRDTNYSYRVRATSNYKLSKYSESSTVRIILNAPTNLIISVFADTLSVSWLNNSYLNSIDIEMSTDSTNYVKINTLSYSINFIKVVVNLAPNNKYFFRLKGAGKYNSSLYSSVGRFQCILDAPTNLTYLFYDDTKIKLTWQDNSNCESGFEIEKSTDNLSFTKITDLTANVTTVDILGTYFLGTNYYYRVRAKNNNNSVYSNTALATVVLNAPSNLTSSFYDDTKLKLTWQDNSLFETAFEIEQSPDNITFEKISETAANTTTVDVTGSYLSEIYYFRIRAKTNLNYSNYSNQIIATLAPVLVFVQGGTFTIGDASYATPLHQVTLSSYYISKTEVTQGQYKAVIGSNPSAFSSVGDNGPVENVTWYDCISYCNKLSIKTGKTPCYSIGGNTSPSDWTSGAIVCDFTAKGYRLVTEAEWEYAARGGNKSAGYSYSGSNTIDNVTWYSSNSGYTTHIVGTKTANELGINDMSGNVWEWCWDWYSSYTSSTQTNPTGATSGSYRVLRGGSCYYNAINCLPGYRRNSAPSDRNYNNGFRVVQSQ